MTTSLRYGPAQCVVVDPAVLGTNQFRWPVDPRLVTELHWGLYRAVFRLTTGHDEGHFDAGVTALLLRFKIIVVIANRLAERIMIDAVRAGPSPGIAVEHFGSQSGEFSSLYALQPTSRLQALRWALAWWGQRSALRVIDWLRVPRPLLTVANESVEPSVRFKWKWRIRAPYMLVGKRVRIAPRDRSRLAGMARRLAAEVDKAARAHGLRQDAAERAEIVQYIESELIAGFGDYQSLMRTLGRRPFTFVGGSLTDYVATLLALVARSSGGEAHGSVHGGDMLATWHQGSYLMEILIASVWWAPNEKAAGNLRALVARELGDRVHAKFRIRAENPYAKYLKKTRPRRDINRVALISVGSPLHITNCGSFPLPVYLDLEIRLVRLLKDLGKEVTYKAHPEDRWQGHRALFGDDVEIELRPLSQVIDRYDAVVFLNACSSTLIDCYASNAAILLLDDNWHNFWESRAREALRRRCRSFSVRVQNGRFEFDAAEFTRQIEAPLNFDEKPFCQFYGLDESMHLCAEAG